MNLEKNLAEGKNFALLTQNISLGVRRLDAPTEKHIPALGMLTPKTRAPSQLWRARRHCSSIQLAANWSGAVRTEEHGLKAQEKSRGEKFIWLDTLGWR